MKLSQDTSLSMPIKNMIGIVVAVAMGIFAYTELTSRLTSLETSRELFESDLLKKSMAKKGIFGPSKNDQKRQNFLFSQTSFFTLFSQM